MNLGNLQAFIAVAEAGSIHRAALRLHLTQPAVTRRIQNLEAVVGAPLLDRSSRPPTLTIEGRQVLRLGRGVLQSVSDLLTSAKPGAELSGEFRLGVSIELAEDALCQALDPLVRRYPGLAIRITPGSSVGLVEAMRSAGLDAAIVLAKETQDLDSDLPFRPLGTERVVVVASVATKMAKRVSLAQLAECAWVLNTCAARTSLKKAFDRAGLPLNICAEVHDYELQAALVASGVGLGLLPLGRLRVSRYRRRLVEILVEDFDLTYTTALIWRSSAGRLLPALAILENAFRGECNPLLGKTVGALPSCYVDAGTASSYSPHVNGAAMPTHFGPAPGPRQTHVDENRQTAETAVCGWNSFFLK